MGQMRLCKCHGVPMSPSNRGGFRCRVRNNEWQRQRRKKNPEKCKVWDRNVRLKKFGISEKEYEEMLESQGGVCAVCGCSPEKTRWNKLAIDHCHKTGIVRGLLCTFCNLSLGWLENNTDSIKKYLGAV